MLAAKGTKLTPESLATIVTDPAAGAPEANAIQSPATASAAARLIRYLMCFKK